MYLENLIFLMVVHLTMVSTFLSLSRHLYSLFVVILLINILDTSLYLNYLFLQFLVLNTLSHLHLHLLHYLQITNFFYALQMVLLTFQLSYLLMEFDHHLKIHLVLFSDLMHMSMRGAIPQHRLPARAHGHGKRCLTELPMRTWKFP